MKKTTGKVLSHHSLKLLITMLFSIIFFFILAAVVGPESSKNTFTVIFVIVLYLLCTLLAHVIINYVYFKRSETNIEKQFNKDINAGLYNNLSVPFAVCDMHGIIRLYNKAFARMLDEAGLKTKKLSVLAGFGIDKLMQSGNDGLMSDVADKKYLVRGSVASPDASNMFITVWYDVTDLEMLRKTQSDNDALVALIVIDNLEELLQIEQENFGNAAAEVDRILIDWVTEFGGVIKRYENNKYILIYRAKFLDEFIDNKFEILEKIRAIKVGVNLLSLTVSIGTSNIGSTLQEREKNAQAALEVALGRGGDQAVVKTESNVMFFGGIIKGSQKRSTVKSRTIAQALMSVITKSPNVLIMGHRNPDFDSIGACAGVARLCLFCGIKCNIVVDRNNKNLQKCFEMLSSLSAYDDMFVSAVDAQDYISSDTLLIIVDVNNPSQFEAPEIAKNVSRVVYIDHHRITNEFDVSPVLYYIEPSASSTCELIAEILENSLSVGKLTVQEANLMYAGILLDTKRFSLNTGTRTFTSANYLRSVGANPMAAQELFKTSLDELLRENRFQKQIKVYREKIVISVNNENDNTMADSIAAAKFADKLLTIENIEASFVLLQIDNNVRISARSTGKINVQIILERLKGGGHYDAAATMLADVPLERAMVMLKESIDTYLDIDSKAQDEEKD